MKRFLAGILTLAALAACKPDTYTGPLDSPVGNWEGIKTEYYFNGQMVGEADACGYTAISFYKDGLCCIEGVKGTFPYTYENASGMMVIDKTVWQVKTLTGAEMVMDYVETIYPEDDTAQPVDAGTSEPEVPEESEGTEGSDGSDGSEEPVEPEVPEVPEVKPDANGIILPTEYDGVTIYADKNGYYYESGEDKIYCNFYGGKDETGTLIIDFWYDTHTDHFIPLVREVKK